MYSLCAHLNCVWGNAQVMERSGLWRRHASSLSLDSATPTPASPPAPAEVDRMVAEGRRLLDTSVWTWGRADASQLGLGDGVSRSAPTPLTTLTGVGVRKLVAGRRHALALTIDGRAYVRRLCHQFLFKV